MRKKTLKTLSIVTASLGYLIFTKYHQRKHQKNILVNTDLHDNTCGNIENYNTNYTETFKQETKETDL